MEYPWWVSPAEEWGLSEPSHVRCATCAVNDNHALLIELTDNEIDDRGGVDCERCGRRWESDAATGVAEPE
jgi:hypothetical protein